MRFLHWWLKPQSVSPVHEHGWVTFDKAMTEVRICETCRRIEARFLNTDNWVESRATRLLWAIKRNAEIHRNARKAIVMEARDTAKAKKELDAIYAAAGSWNNVLDDIPSNAPVTLFQLLRAR